MCLPDYAASGTAARRAMKVQVSWVMEERWMKIANKKTRLNAITKEENL